MRRAWPANLTRQRSSRTTQEGSHLQPCVGDQVDASAVGVDEAGIHETRAGSGGDRRVVTIGEPQHVHLTIERVRDQALRAVVEHEPIVGA